MILVFFRKFSAGSVPDDEVELIGGGGSSGNQPGYNPSPSIPPVPHYPLVPSIPPIPSVPSIPTIPTYPYPGYNPGYNPNYPSFHPSYPAYPTYHTPIFPFGWTYNVFDGFSSKFFAIHLLFSSDYQFYLLSFETISQINRFLHTFSTSQSFKKNSNFSQIF